MERDLVEEHRRQQEDEEFFRERDEMIAARGARGPRAEPAPSVASPSPNEDTPPLRPASRASARPQEVVFDRSPMPKGVGVAVAVVLAMATLGWFGIRHFMPSSASGNTAGLPGPEQSAIAPLALASPSIPETLPSEAVDAPLAPLREVLTQESDARRAGDAALSDQLSALNARLDAMEQRMEQVIGGLKAKGYLSADTVLDGPLRPEDFVAHPGNGRRPSQPASARSAPSDARSVAQRAASKPKASAPPELNQQLLSVDLWNGRPSVVVGNGNPAAPAVRVLEPGDRIDGVRLRDVDMASGRATFVNDQNETVTLKVAGQP